MSNKHELHELQQYQSLPLSAKITMTQQRIEAWFEHWGVKTGYVFPSPAEKTAQCCFTW